MTAAAIFASARASSSQWNAVAQKPSHEAVDFFDREPPRALVEEVEAKLADAVPSVRYRAELERVTRFRELAGNFELHMNALTSGQGFMFRLDR